MKLKGVDHCPAINHMPIAAIYRMCCGLSSYLYLGGPTQYGPLTMTLIPSVLLSYHITVYWHQKVPTLLLQIFSTQSILLCIQETSVCKGQLK